MSVDYRHKYLKYKSKYLDAKGECSMAGGMNDEQGRSMTTSHISQKYTKDDSNDIYISGPSSIIVYKNTVLDKIIIVIGDIHGSNEDTCPDDFKALTIVDYMKNLFTTSDIPLDVFIEEYIPDKFSRKEGKLKLKTDIQSGIDYIGELTKLYQSYYKKKDNIRIHFTDIRNQLSGFESYVNFKKIINEIIIYIDSFNETFYEGDWNLFKAIFNIQHYYIDSLTSISKYIEEPNSVYKDLVPEYLLKEIERTDPEITKLLLPITSKYINQYLEIAFAKNSNITLKTLDNLNDWFYKGIDAAASLTDLYTILRIMKNKDIKNSILYVGNKHITILDDYLSKIGFTIHYKYESDLDKSDFRCIKTKPLLTYFNR